MISEDTTERIGKESFSVGSCFRCIQFALINILLAFIMQKKLAWGQREFFVQETVQYSNLVWRKGML